MTRKFLFCFPLRVGNIVFGYIVIILSIAVVAYNLYLLALTIVTSDESERESKFGNFEHLENIFGQSKKDLVLIVTLAYYISYVAVGFLLFLFSSLFVCGAYQVNNCLVYSFFVYILIHLFLTIGLVVWEAATAGWLQLGLILASDVLLIICLFSVKYLSEAIRTGKIYSHPEEVYDKY